MNLEPGIHDNIAAADYHADPCPEPSLSSSIAKLLCLQSPRHAWQAHARLNPAAVSADDERFDIGTAAHALLLEGDGGVEIIDAGDWRTKVAKEARDAARAKGKTPMLAGKWTAVQTMVASIREQLDRHTDGGQLMFLDGQRENTLVWKDEEFGVWCRARIDWWIGRTEGCYIADLKTCEDADPERCSRALFSSGYDVQAAFYMRGFAQVMEAESVFRFVFVEKEPPHCLSVVSLGPDALMLAEKRVRYALETWKRCLDSGEWPGWPDRTCYATLPPWVESQWLEKEMMTADGRKVFE